MARFELDLRFLNKMKFRDKVKTMNLDILAFDILDKFDKLWNRTYSQIDFKDKKDTLCQLEKESFTTDNEIRLKYKDFGHLVESHFTRLPKKM